MASNFCKFFLMLMIFSTCFAQNCPKKKMVICYWASWASYRPGAGVHNINQIIPQYCTHLVYSFAGINLSGSLDSLDFNKDVTKGGYKDFIDLKRKNPCAKFLLGVGGWNEGSEKYSLMAETAESRTKFADEVLRFLIHFGFDGVDIDWEYPASRGGLPKDKDNFIALLDVLNKKLKPRRRILSAAVSAVMSITKVGYDIVKMCSLVDFISIMGYDLHDPTRTSMHSQLLLEDGESNHRDSIDATVQYYKQNGCVAEKIVLGIPAYGRTYTLQKAANSYLGAPVKGLGKPGPYTREKGFLGFNEICEMISKKGWQKKHLPRSASNYIWNKDQWISYDDPDTIAQKARYVLNQNLAGVMVWSIDTDDFYGDCFNKSYPLLWSINNVFKN